MQITDEMVERAARALSGAQAGDNGETWDNDDPDDEYKNLYRRDAKITLQAALNPERIP